MYNFLKEKNLFFPFFYFYLRRTSLNGVTCLNSLVTLEIHSELSPNDLTGKIWYLDTIEATATDKEKHHK
jgi:hypothetical protein